MGDNLTALEDWVQPLLAKLTTSQRNALARKVGQALRKSQAQRIASQQAPDGAPYAPRKPTKLRAKAGQIRKEAMFPRLRTAKWLKVQVDAEGVAVGFFGRPSYQYPVRELLGFTAEERETIQDLILQHLNP